jgi:N-methylhydantoinase B
MKTRQTVDPVTKQVVRNALAAAADEMKLTLLRTAHSPLIYETLDFSVALTNRKAELVGQSAGLACFLGSLAMTVRNGLKRLGSAGFEDGDVVIANDPYETGTHIVDTALYAPIFYLGELVAFAGNMAHWSDIGGSQAGGWNPASTSIYEEGLRFVHKKLYERGELNTTLFEFILDNLRFPDLAAGDIRAQVAACHTAARRYVALCDKYGPDSIDLAMEAAFDDAEQLVRAAIDEMPDGSYQAEMLMDHDGVVTDKPVKLKVTVTIDGSDMIIDTTGSERATVGGVNTGYIGTLAAAQYALKALTVPLEPPNEGHVRPLKVIAPPDTVFNAQYPSPCDSYGYVLNFLPDLVFKALSEAIPDKCPAGNYTLFGSCFFRTDPRYGRPFICMEPVFGGWGGRPGRDGQNAVIFNMDGDTYNMPVEAVETRYPLLVERHMLNPASAGAGKYRGGFGVIRDYQALEDSVDFFYANEQTINPPWGLLGGQPAASSYIIVRPGTSQQRILRAKGSTIKPLAVGEELALRSGGGGGWGDPRQRDPDLVLEDVRNEFITKNQGRDEYAVVIRGRRNPIVDLEATKQLRKAHYKA